MKVARFGWDAANPHRLAGEIRQLQPGLGEVSEDVAAIIEGVGSRGDRALLEYEQKLGGTRPASLRVSDEDIAAAVDRSEGLRPALEAAARSIRAVAEAEVAAESPSHTEGEFGQEIEMRSVPVATAGGYVPGGAASYPSTALMCTIPARVAGVERVVVATPPGSDGLPDPAVLAACALAGVDAVYAAGGAQAIAALALGTETVPPVDVVVGPGNRYVQEAKRQLYGRVGIEGIAGPSELMVILDESVDLPLVTFDLCAQAEHGSDGLLVAASANEELLNLLGVEVEALANDPKWRIEDSSLALVHVPNLSAAVSLANDLAPEHLELALEEGAEVWAKEVRYAGCVFLGLTGATAFGDYAAGSNHVLPTGGAGRFTGPLGPQVFRRRIANVTVPPKAVNRLAGVTDTLAQAEGLPMHGESVMRRLRYPEPESK